MFIRVENTLAKSATQIKSAIYAMAEADVVFSGKVIKVKYLDDPVKCTGEPRTVVTIKVYRVWKGPIKKEFALHTVEEKWSGYGYNFKEGKDYLIFANATPGYSKEKQNKNDKVYMINTYGGTGYLNHSNNFLKELGEGKKP